MTAQPRKHCDREPGPVDSPLRTADPPLEGDFAPGAASCAGRDSRGGRLAYSVDEAASLTALCRDLLYDQMRLGNLAYIKLGRRCQTIRDHLQHFLGIAS